MTEAEWLNGWDYRRMYDVIRERTTIRQVRLHMVACCRLKATEFFDPRIERALEIAEWCADDLQAEFVANGVDYELSISPRPELPDFGPEGEIARGVVGVWQLLGCWKGWDGEHYFNAQHAIAHAAYLCLRDRPREVFTGGDGNAAEYCARAIDRAESLLSGMKPEEASIDEDGQRSDTGIRRAIANVLRDIFGNPFRRVTVDPAWLAWNDGTVVKMAQCIYEDRAFDQLPILADALEEAGCVDTGILRHCRQEGEHVRGCWVVDLLLGKH